MVCTRTLGLPINTETQSNRMNTKGKEAFRRVSVCPQVFEQESVYTDGIFLLFGNMKLSVVVALVLAAGATAADIRTDASGASGPAMPITSASTVAAATGVQQYEGGILEPTERSKEIEAKRGGSTFKKPVTCDGQYGKPCMTNTDCPCTNFCFFDSKSTIEQGKCEMYKRAVHSK